MTMLIKIFKFILISLLITLVASFIIQVIFPAPSWNSICSGAACDQVGKTKIQQLENYYFYIIRLVSYIVVLVFASIALFFRKKRLGKWFLTLSLSSLIYPTFQQRVFEYGNYPDIWVIFLLFGVSLFILVMIIINFRRRRESKL